MDWTDIFGRAAAIFFPCRCVLCGDVTSYDDMCCQKCEFNKAGVIDCSGLPHSFAGALAGMEYSGRVRGAILSIKQKPDERILQFFAEEMLTAMRRNWNGIIFDLLVPVPSSPLMLRERGFNHAEKLAQKLSKLTGIPMCVDTLIRYDESKVQHSLNRTERLANAKRAYDIAEPKLVLEHISGKTVLLVDDVFTTGATLSACADKLISAGSKNVYVIAAVYTPPAKN